MEGSGDCGLVVKCRIRRGLRSQVDEEQPEATNGHAATIASFSLEELVAENRRLLEENGRLKKVEERLVRENAKLRKDMNVVKVKNREHKRQLQIAGAEVDRLKECYRTTMEERVALAEQLAVSDCAIQKGDVLSLSLQGPAKLPLEILLSIAGFVAGNNDYGTLLSLHIMSKRFKEETTPLFYETVLEPDIEYLCRKPESKLGLEVYRFTRYDHASRNGPTLIPSGTGFCIHGNISRSPTRKSFFQTSALSSSNHRIDVGDSPPSTRDSTCNSQLKYGSIVPS